MSGPKVSSYELDQIHLQALRKQQEEELRRRMEQERRQRIEMNRRSIEKCKSQAKEIDIDVFSKWKLLVDGSP